MRTRIGKAGLSAVALLAAGTTLAACGSSGSSTSTGGNSQGTGSGVGFQKISLNEGGTPKTGGTLNIVATGDVDNNLDPNVAYYSIDYGLLRLYSRQLYAYKPTPGHQTEIMPDLATGMPTITDGGKTYTMTIRQGAMWDTSPARQVTAADFIRGLKITCNPYQGFGGTPDFSSFIVGYQSFCDAFSKVKPNPAAIKAFVDSHQISGVSVGNTPETIVMHLTQPANFFTNELTLPAFSPRPVEQLAYLPKSAQFAQHTFSDGPYKVASYNPTHSIDFVRNPAWKASTDPVRKAYVNEIKITEGVQQSAAQQQVLTGAADTTLDTWPAATQANSLIRQNNPDLNVQSEIASNPYIVFNTASPNNNRALQNVQVRQAISYALKRTNFIQDMGGPKLNPLLTHILPPQIEGSQNASYYPYNPSKAKQMLKAAHVSNLNLKILYRPASSSSTSIYQDMQNQLQSIGVKVTPVTATPEDFYAKYLTQKQVAQQGQWDLAIAGWGPDWYGNAALSFFQPLFNGNVLPPLSSNFGLFNDQQVNQLIKQASTATSVSQSNRLWNEADKAVMEQAAIYPITDPNQAVLHSSNLHNTVYMPAFETFDYANCWLS